MIYIIRLFLEYKYLDLGFKILFVWDMLLGMRIFNKEWYKFRTSTGLCSAKKLALRAALDRHLPKNQSLFFTFI